MQLNETRIVKPSVNMLPIEDIKGALDRKVEAIDTANVGGVPATDIAKAYEGDREAVKRAYFLGEYSADQYIRTDNDPTEAVKNLASNYHEEVGALRLEVYRLYEILNRQLNAMYKPESGFLERFKQIEAHSTPITKKNTEDYITHFIPNKADFAIPGEYIVICKQDTDEQEIAQIESIEDQIYKIKGSVNITGENIEIKKIVGDIARNTFSFCKLSNTSDTDGQHNVVLGDAEKTKQLRINSGLATSIVMTSNMLAASGQGDKAILDAVRVYITREGIESAPQLSCKIYKITNEKDNVPVLELIGLSDTQDISISKWVTFNISKANAASNKDKTVEINKEDKLLIALECNGSNNYYVLGGQTANKGDLHGSRFIYIKDENGEYHKSTDADCDILLGLTLKAFKPLTITPINKGLYTSETFTNHREEHHMAQLHVKLENLKTYKVISETPQNSQNGFVIDGQMYGSNTLVVGNHVLHRVESENNTIKTEELAAVYPNDIVYPLPIKAQIVTVSELFQEEEVKTVVPMIPKRSIDDYVVFECDLPPASKRYNIQILYEDNNPKSNAVALSSVAVSLI